MKEIFKAVQDASRELLALTEEIINEILLAVADATIANAAYILSEKSKGFGSYGRSQSQIR